MLSKGYIMFGENFFTGDVTFLIFKSCIVCKALREDLVVITIRRTTNEFTGQE